jgi:orotate phosphoribosyltransferase
MDINQLAQQIFKVSHITGEFKLRSGIISNEYFDKYQFESDPVLLTAIAEHLSKKIFFDFDILSGLEVGGIPIATLLATKINKPIVFVRKKAKEYGTAKLVEGPEINGKHLLIVEDVVTSGGQIIESVNELRRLGAIINYAICVIDREQSGRENLKKHNIELLPLFSMSQLKKS